MEVSSSCELPPDRKQVYHINKKPSGNCDALSEVMYTCKNTEKTNDKFI